MYIIENKQNLLIFLQIHFSEWYSAVLRNWCLVQLSPERSHPATKCSKMRADAEILSQTLGRARGTQHKWENDVSLDAKFKVSYNFPSDLTIWHTSSFAFWCSLMRQLRHLGIDEWHCCWSMDCTPYIGYGLKPVLPTHSLFSTFQKVYYDTISFWTLLSLLFVYCLDILELYLQSNHIYFQVIVYSGLFLLLTFTPLFF